MSCPCFADIVKNEKDIACLQRTILELVERYGPDAESIATILLSQKQKPESKKAKQIQQDHPAKIKKVFEMSKYRQHHVAMEFQYEGGPYFGFASQVGECEETIEKYIFEALLKCRLIENRQECGYSRCGRTDRGVSALGQILSFNLRSALPLGISRQTTPKHICDTFQPIEVHHGNNASIDSATSALAQQQEIIEMDYCAMLNRCLPPNIRCTGWAAVTPEFSARFSCASRTYRYFFTRKNLDVASMGHAAELLVGNHDFRHMCKMDVANISNFRRDVYSAKILLFSESAGQHPEEAVWMLEIKGIAFLWHMVRCIMAVLFLVGEGKEKPSVIPELLNVTLLLGKPQYSMAAEEPLVLHQCGFDNLIIQRSPRTLFDLTTHFEKLWETSIIAASRARNAIGFLKTCTVRERDLRAYGEEKSKRSQKHGGRVSMIEKEEYQIEGVDNDGESVNGSRKRPKIETAPNSCKVMSWRDAMLYLHNYFAIDYPFTTSTNEGGGQYIPLLRRKLSEQYEERKEHLGGVRKERLDRHLKMQEEEERDPNFFSRMRAQGNI